MKAYFTASISGKSAFEKSYNAIVESLKKCGYEVYDHILKTNSNQIELQTDKERIAYYKKMVEMISKCDLCVAEVSTSSLSVGHEITIAVEKGKPVIAFHDKKITPNLIKGINSEKFQTVAYDKDNLDEAVRSALDKARSNMDIRFNFFISPKINEYLDWISRVKRVPRAVYLRELVEKEIEKNKEYKKS
jgi:nucleoside 2-deoxyribosyltransferase